MFDRLFSGTLAVACTASLLACIPAAYPDARIGAAAAAPVQTTAEIEGQWDIVRFAGYEPRRLNGITRAAVADFRADGVGLQIECNASGVSGEVVRGRFVARPGDRIQTLVGCGPEREARDAKLFGFFDRDPTVERLADGRLRLEAGGTELLLERPAQRRLAFLPSPQELLGEWRLAEVARYSQGNGYAAIGLSDTAGVLIFDGIMASHTACPRYALRYRYTKDGRIENIERATAPDRPVGCDALHETPRGPDMPVPWDAIRVLHDNPMIERVDKDTLLMSTEDFGVLLTRQR